MIDAAFFVIHRPVYIAQIPVYKDTPNSIIKTYFFLEETLSII